MNETAALTREQLKALKNADSIVFRFHSEDSPHVTDRELPATWIEAIKTINPGDGFGERDRRVEIPTGQALLHSYNQGVIQYASWVFLHTDRSHPLGTLIHGFLRAGDRLQPEFVAGNNNDHVRDAGLTVDEVHLRVERGPLDDPSKVKRFRFMLDTCVYPPHSLARNIHFYSPEYMLRNTP